MRYVREISQLSDHQSWNLQAPRKRRRECERGMAAKSRMGAKNEALAAKLARLDFCKMTTAQIASVMQGEQAAMESRLESTVAFLRAEKRRRCFSTVETGREEAELEKFDEKGMKKLRVGH